MFDQSAGQPAPDESPAPIGMRESPPQPAKPVMPAYATSVSAAPAPEATPQPVRTAPNDSVIARDDHLEGTFTSRGTIRVLGSVKGRIEAVRVHIEEGAHVEADVIVDEAIVAGEFTGNLTCRQRLEAHASGRISGRVETHKLMLHEGASVEGEMHMLTEARDASETIRGAAPIRGGTVASAPPATLSSEPVVPTARTSAPGREPEAPAPAVAPGARSAASKTVDASKRAVPASDTGQGSATPRPEASAPHAEAHGPVRRSLVAETLRAETMRLTPRTATPASTGSHNGARARNGTSTTGF